MGHISLLIFVFTATIIFLHILYLFSVKHKILLDKNTKKPQAFHIKPTPMIGGTFLIISIFFNAYYLTDLANLNFYLIAFFLFYLVGIIDDINFANNPIVRLFFLIIISFLTIYILDFKVSFTDIIFIDYLISNYIFSVIFTIICILFIVNGVNFLDGFNGLIAIHTIIILSTLLIVNDLKALDLLKMEINKFIIISIICISFFLIYNFPFGKIFLGDSGSYFVGIMTSVLVIDVYKITINQVSPVFYAIILHLIFFEVFFSYFRKLLVKKNPFYPDKNHIHMVIYRILNQFFQSKVKANYFTSIIYNIYFIFSILPAFYFKMNTLFCTLYFFSLLIIYLLLYFFLINFKLTRTIRDE